MAIWCTCGRYEREGERESMCYGLTVDGYITCMQEIRERVRERVRERQKEGERERDCQ